MIPSRAKTKFYRIYVSTILARVSCFGMLRHGTSVDLSCLEIVGSDGIRSYAPMFYVNVWFQKEH
jgi:hypothetical protein